MIFTGNPGTAKTTVARLFAQIMKENGLLSKGDIHEVGRADLVGQYVGWTAQCVKDAFKKAKGGVLFIDEAYSLVDGHSGSFGDEAINTIVQEMENHRADVVVIFAGYPDKMEQFLAKNPGLRSRVAFHVPFEDYNSEELCQIADMISKKNGMNIEKDALDKLSKAFDVAKTKSDFGNGRYVRNVFEQAKMNQASRLLQKDFESITADEITTITADDIVIPESKKVEKIRIGFC
jgi:SpoVK/Ycf46/Vps4 family AAA+-type ATPase